MKKIAGVLTGLLLVCSLAGADEIQYTNRTFARMSYVTGNTYVQRAADLGYEEGVVNMPITEGDRIGTTDGRAEIYLGRGSYLRLDRETKVDFMRLPLRGNDITQIQVWAGHIYFRISRMEDEKEIEIHTSDVSLYVLDPGLYRIDIRENAETEIFVFSGMLEAAGESGSTLIKDAQRLEAVNGRFISSPSRFAADVEDSFDRWSEYRDLLLGKRMARRYLPDDLADFEYELAEYGEWVYRDPYGYVWTPGGMAATWRPYYNGRWIWYPISGWTWLPYEPWGWITFHYGRWHWAVGIGWHWIPTTVWGPGWVSWYVGTDYWGWAPLSYYGYPGVIINNVYYSRYSEPYYPPSSPALTVIHKNQLASRNISRVALEHSRLNSLDEIRLSRQAPSVRPSTARVSVQKSEGKRVFLRNREESGPVKSEAGVRRSGSSRLDPSVSTKSTAKSPPEKRIKNIEPRNIPKSATRKSSEDRSRTKSKQAESKKSSSSSLGQLVNRIAGKSTSSSRSGSSQGAVRSSTRSGSSSGSKTKSSTSRSSGGSKSTKSTTKSRSSSTKRVKKKK